MRRFGIALLAGMAVVLTSLSVAAVGEEIVLRKIDQNGDGKTDWWRWSVNDRTTTVSFDQNYDGKPDVWRVFGELNGKHQVVREWWDRDGNGKQDRLFVRNADGSTETWEKRKPKKKGEKPVFDYFKRDPNLKVSIHGTAPAFNSRVVDNITTGPFLKSKRLSGNVKVVSDSKGRLREVYSRFVEQGLEITTHGYSTTGTVPRVTRVGDKKNGLYVTLFDPDLDGRYEAIEWIVGGETTLATDRNGDGIYEVLRIEGKDRSRRVESDRDGDGLMDVLEVTTAKGTQHKLYGEQILDRTMPVLPQGVAEILRALAAVEP